MSAQHEPQGRIERGRLLVVDDDSEMCRFLESALGKRGFDVQSAESAEQALERLEQAPVDAVITDLNLRGKSGTQLCETVVGTWPEVPVILLTAYGSLETAVAAIRAGAYDFITKPLELEVLELAVERALAHRRTRAELRQLRDAGAAAPPTGMVGESVSMRSMYDTVHRVAETDTSVLLTGESGTGKELVAHAIHHASRRSGGPFVALNCAALPEALLESELFGYEKGAFTDARSSRSGLFVQAQRGTLFLDEIGDMPLSLQPKLLRVLQERKVRPLGGTREVPVDFRIVAATHHDLETRVEEGSFRDDLYYRIAVIALPLPPLRERGQDVLLLARHFIQHFSTRMGRTIAGLSPDAAQKLLSYDFPGNVRELQNLMERAVALTRHTQIELEDLPERVRNKPPDSAATRGKILSLAEIERRHIIQVLEQMGGNKTLAAQLLGVDRKTLTRKLEAWSRAASPHSVDIDPHRH